MSILVTMFQNVPCNAKCPLNLWNHCCQRRATFVWKSVTRPHPVNVKPLYIPNVYGHLIARPTKVNVPFVGGIWTQLGRAIVCCALWS